MTRACESGTSLWSTFFGEGDAAGTGVLRLLRAGKVIRLPTVTSHYVSLRLVLTRGHRCVAAVAGGKVIRLFTRMPSLRKILHALYTSIPAMTNAMLLTGLVMCMVCVCARARASVCARVCECACVCLSLSLALSLSFSLPFSLPLSLSLRLPLLRVLKRTLTWAGCVRVCTGCLLCYCLASRLDTIFVTFILQVPAMGVTSCLTSLFTEAVPKQHVGFATG